MFDGLLHFQISEKMGKFAVSIEHSEAKSVSASGGGFAPLTSRPWALPLDPAGAPPLDPRYRLALCALAMASLCQILNTPPAFFWLQFKRRQDTVVGNHEHWTV